MLTNPIIAMEMWDDNINETNCYVSPEFHAILNLRHYEKWGRIERYVDGTCRMLWTLHSVKSNPTTLRIPCLFRKVEFRVHWTYMDFPCTFILSKRGYVQHWPVLWWGEVLLGTQLFRMHRSVVVLYVPIHSTCPPRWSVGHNFLWDKNVSPSVFHTHIYKGTERTKLITCTEWKKLCAITFVI